MNEPTPSSTTTSWWRREELLRLIQAWGEALAPPRARDLLSASEKELLHARYVALSGGRDDRRVAAIERQRLRLVMAYQFIARFDRESAASGSPTWFQLSKVQQDEMRRVNDRGVGMTSIDEEMFQAIARICEPMPSMLTNTEASWRFVPNTAQLSTIGNGEPTFNTKTNRHQQGERIDTDADGGKEEGSDDQGSREELNRENEIKAAAEALAGLPIFRERTTHSSNLAEPSASRRNSRKAPESDMTHGTPPKWKRRDEMRLIHAWDDVLRRLVATNQQCSTLNPQVHERYLELEGSSVRSAQSIGGKRNSILASFEFLQDYLNARRADAPEWFSMSIAQRLEEQRAQGHHQTFACSLDRATYDRLDTIVKNQQRLNQINMDSMHANSQYPGFAAQASYQGHELSTRWPPRVLSNSAGDSEDDEGSSVPRTQRTASGRGVNLPRRYRAYGNGNDSDSAISSSPKRRRLASPKQGGPNGAWYRPDAEGKEGHQDGAADDDEDDGFDDEEGGKRRPVPAPMTLVNQLMQAQMQRLEMLLEEFRDERRQERQQTQELLLLLLSKSNGASRNDAAVLEALVEQQRQQIVTMFDQLHEERQSEQQAMRALLQELEGGYAART